MGRVARLDGRAAGRLSGGPAYLSVGRGSDDRGVTVTLHSFSGGYRVLVEEWGRGEDRVLWLASVEEGEKSYIGLFSEEKLRAAFPHLVTPDNECEERD